ncbi:MULTISPECIES: hypothetical protein [unclassified Brevibacillus]|uniref:hypothetical protein n=1 Tax=unclassified Brevibacillus TaxID=2684853 RepID=UPI003564A167
MPRKRRYYREERREPRYYDDYDDDECDEDDEELAMSERLVNGALWTILGVLAIGSLLSFAHTLYSPQAVDNSGYRVVSVSRGRVHTEEVGTGKSVSFPDRTLVDAALKGKIKRGDVIYR